MQMTLDIADLRPIQTRAATDAATIDEYAEAAQRGAKFPPVSVVSDATRGTLWLWDGTHRVEAARKIGKSRIRADVAEGTYADALRLALCANATHGLRRSNADKRHALEMAWENRETLFGGDPSQNMLAEMCGISRKTVERFMAEKVATLSQPEKGATPVQPIQMSQPGTPVQPMQMSQPGTPANGTRAPVPVRRTIGRDGKTYTRAIPAPQATSHAPAYSHARGVMTDRFGVEIPIEIRDAFKMETVRDEIEKHLAQAARTLKRALDDKDPSVTQFRQADLIDIQNAVRTAKFTRPWCVCRICQGNGRGSCAACHETGFQTEAQYENNPNEFKA